MKGKVFIDRNMAKGQKDYRPEQMKTTKILRDEFPKLDIRQEHLVNNLEIDGHKVAPAILDIAIISPKIAIRMMGEIHQGSKRVRMKDQYQMYALENAGWKVIDMIKDEFPAVWNRSKKDDKLNEAKEEILTMLKSENIANM
tara:strand:+ start:421 stop:846 length:426 start_codon:yes stop_codon:yes gene_type:complete